MALLESYKPDLIELRYDLMQIRPGELIPQQRPDIRHIATCRPGTLKESQRLKLLVQAIESGASYVDVEVESDASFLKEIKSVTDSKNCDLIISYHNYQETPESNYLAEQFEACIAAGADLVKIATEVKVTGDLVSLLELYKHPMRKVILGMGKLGKFLRISALSLGSEFTFAALNQERLTAPGQLTYEEMKYIEKLL